MLTFARTINVLGFRMRLISPEVRLNTKFVDGLNKTTKVMAQHLTEHFISLRDYCFTTYEFCSEKF